MFTLHGYKGQYQVAGSALFQGVSFCEILLPQLSRDGPFAVIGDNLGSYFNATIIQARREKNIKFTPFPAIGCCCFYTFEESMEVIVRGVAEGIKEQRNSSKGALAFTI